MQLGFAIDQRTCIGCHACTVACKTEHEVPLGQFRTWVKYVDSGTFPDSTRSFGVMRCNHCTDAPCVKICPTQALFKREDGIVDFDNSRCIGCKSCMQGCPYDAIYIDHDTHTAAKCNLCAHRIDEDLEPACVVVCPTHSIWVGDLDDPESGISRLVATNQTQVRAAEQNTGPNVFYLGADQAVLDPLAAPVDDTYIWAKPDAQRLETQGDLHPNPTKNPRVTLNTAHPRPWGWRVTTYLWTKAFAAGALAIAGLAMLLGLDLGWLGSIGAPIIGLVGVTVTAVLLVWDLKRPERFLYIFLKSNFTSWLVLGSYGLVTFSGIAGIWFLDGLFGDALGVPSVVMTVLAVLAIPFGALTAGYTAFLFGQAEGRDLWQSPLLFWHLLAQATMVGSGALLVVGAFAGLDNSVDAFLARVFVIATLVHVGMSLLEFLGRHSSRQAATAAHIVTHGRYAPLFWYGAIIGALAAAAIGSFDWNGTLAVAGVIGGLVAQGALLALESTFVRAGQDAPLS